MAVTVLQLILSDLHLQHSSTKNSSAEVNRMKIGPRYIIRRRHIMMQVTQHPVSQEVPVEQLGRRQEPAIVTATRESGREIKKRERILRENLCTDFKRDTRWWESAVTVLHQSYLRISLKGHRYDCVTSLFKLLCFIFF